MFKIKYCEIMNSRIILSVIEIYSRFEINDEFTDYDFSCLSLLFFIHKLDSDQKSI
jgi:hypothetical protein